MQLLGTKRRWIRLLVGGFVLVLVTGPSRGSRHGLSPEFTQELLNYQSGNNGTDARTGWKRLDLNRMVSLSVPAQVSSDPNFEVEIANSFGFRDDDMFLSFHYGRGNRCTSTHFLLSDGKVKFAHRLVGGRPAEVAEQTNGDRLKINVCVANVGDGRHQFESEVICPKFGKHPDLRAVIDAIFDSISFPSVKTEPVGQSRR